MCSKVMQLLNISSPVRKDSVVDLGTLISARQGGAMQKSMMRSESRWDGFMEKIRNATCV